MGQVAHGVAYWVRWVLVLPAGILVALLALFPLHWLVLLMHYFTRNEEGLSLWNLTPATLEQLGMALVVPFTLVTIGARVAPAFRLHTAVALSILVLLLSGAGVASNVILKGREGWGWVELAFALAFNVAACIAAYHWVKQREVEHPQRDAGRRMRGA